MKNNDHVAIGEIVTKRDLVFLLILVLIPVFCIALSVYANTTPGPRFPFASTPLAQEIHPTCGSGGCYYLREYDAAIAEDEALRLFAAKGWECKIEKQDSAFFDIPKPYWDCRSDYSKAFISVRVAVELEKTESAANTIRLYAVVSWSD